jgi:hypothetical protein
MLRDLLTGLHSSLFLRCFLGGCRRGGKKCRGALGAKSLSKPNIELSQVETGLDLCLLLVGDGQLSHR